MLYICVNLFGNALELACFYSSFVFSSPYRKRREEEHLYRGMA